MYWVGALSVSAAHSEVVAERARLGVRSITHVPDDDLPAIGQVADETETVRRRSLYQVLPQERRRYRSPRLSPRLRRLYVTAAARHTSQSSQSRHTRQVRCVNSCQRGTVTL